MLIIVMGVSGSGKSTIGLLLAQRLRLPFVDADDYHSKENVRKMTEGNALTDVDRLKWLQKLNKLLKEASKQKGIVMACSALKEDYRIALQQDLSQKIKWIFLHGTNSLLSQRIMDRKDHFMPAGLLESQLAILEKPGYGIHVNVEKSPDEIINIICNKLDDEI